MYRYEQNLVIAVKIAITLTRRDTGDGNMQLTIRKEDLRLKLICELSNCYDIGGTET